MVLAHVFLPARLVLPLHLLSVWWSRSRHRHLPLPGSLPPLLWKPILVACAETSLEISELRAGAPLLNCCRYSGQVELALWRRRWWLTFIAASLQPGHVECDVFHFVSVTIMNPVPWTGSATGIAPCQIGASLIEPPLRPWPFDDCFQVISRHFDRERPLHHTQRTIFGRALRSAADPVRTFNRLCASAGGYRKPVIAVHRD